MPFWCKVKTGIPIFSYPQWGKLGEYIIFHHLGAWEGQDFGKGHIFSEIRKVFAEKGSVLKFKFEERAKKWVFFRFRVFWFCFHPTPCHHPREKLDIRNTKY